MTATILCADAHNLPLPDAGVDLVVTSPPYFALRSYTDGGKHYAGQIGAEPTPAEYIASLIDCTREWMRVLKPGGSLFVNLGDKYGGAQWETKHGRGNRQMAMPGGLQHGAYIADETAAGAGRSRALPGTRHKSLILLPERYRIAAVDELGLIARAVIVWSKPNGLPESVTDRVRRSHEDWVHLVKAPRYFSAVDEIREAHTGGTHPSGKNAAVQKWESGKGVRHRTGRSDPELFNPLGKLPGSVWEIATEPLKVPDHLGVDHFAAFPTEWPRRIILGWSPSGICTACGEGRKPVSEKSAVGKRQTGNNGMGDLAGRETFGLAEVKRGEWANDVRFTITGEACACPGTSAPTRPAVIVDPFGGTGTTALVASVLGRHGISVDMSADYCRLARWRTTDPGQRAKAARVEAPPKQLDGQGDLFDLAGVS